MPPRKKVSQQKIAKDLGVSQALVSLALNGRKEGIGAETYQRIWEHAISLGYQPKGMQFERSPREARVRQVGFILRAGLNIHTQGSYFNHVLHGLHTGLAERGFAAVFIGSEDALSKERLRQFFHTGHSLQGIVLLGEVGAPFLSHLRQLEKRIVAVSARHTGHCHSVVGNEPHALEVLVQHLHELGHTRIGWLGGNAGLGRHESRYSAYLAALKLAGLQADERYAVFLKQGDRAEGSEAILRLLPFAERKDFPTAFITYNLHMSIGATHALIRAGKTVPGDLSIAAADYSPLAQQEEPRITAAGCEAEKLGRAAAKLALDSTGDDDESFHDLILPSHLFVGQSTGPARPPAR
ncbi:MAG: LacI family DNA-binding transcriptional regulator [Candidatus Didemnitutus sp.]|nr:LacI family DNA-binding transcriptional regulator [Candidatus Didemnitutus sp.]